MIVGAEWIYILTDQSKEAISSYFRGGVFYLTIRLRARVFNDQKVNEASSLIVLVYIYRSLIA